MKAKLVTAGVVFGGIVALAVAVKLGAHPEWVATGGAALGIVAGMLRSMVLPEKKE